MADDDTTPAELASRTAGPSALEALAKDAAKPQVLMIYGRGADLGDFSVFANSLKRELAPKYAGEIDIQNVERKVDFFALLKKPKLPGRIRELHIFSHSIGAGLFLGYGDLTIQAARNRALRMATPPGRKLTFEEVLNTEVGAVLTDDLLTTTAQADKAAIRANLAVGRRRRSGAATPVVRIGHIVTVMLLPRAIHPRHITGAL